MATTTVPAADPVTAAADALAALKAAYHALDSREAETTARLERITATELPAAEDAHALALAAGDKASRDAIHVLEVQRTNCESVLRGVALKRAELARLIPAAEAKHARARACAALPPLATGELAQECIEEGFAHLAEVIANGLRPALAALPRDDVRGVTEAFDEAALARWVVTQCAQAGLNLDTARFAQHGAGRGPLDTLANVLTIVETL